MVAVAVTCCVSVLVAVVVTGVVRVVSLVKVVVRVAELVTVDVTVAELVTVAVVVSEFVTVAVVVAELVTVGSFFDPLIFFISLSLLVHMSNSDWSNSRREGLFLIGLETDDVSAAVLEDSPSREGTV